MSNRLLILITLFALSLSVWGQRADNYPPDDMTVNITSTNLPIVWIDVDGAQIDTEERITAHMKIIHNGDGNLNYGDTVAHPGQHIDYEGYIALRYRGNTSFSQSDRKPYSFRTLDKPLEQGGEKKKVSILGMGKDNNWALLAPYADKSMIRDVLSFELARPWMEYTPVCKFCEVYLDGIYYGIYIMTEVVSAGKHRLNLPDPGEEGDELTGGYLLEVDRENEPHMTSSHFPVSNTGTPYTNRHCYYQFRSPDYTDMTSQQRNYIIQRVNTMENVLASNNYTDSVNGYRKYLDVQNFVDYQLFMEFAHNPDAYRLSGKFFKRRDSEDERFKMVLWDMNLSYGNSAKNQSYRTDTWMYNSNNLLYSSGDKYLIPFWWYQLNRDSYFTNLFKQRWAQCRNSNMRNERIMATVDSLTLVLTSCGAMDRNSQAWPRWGVWVWPNQYVAPNYQSEIAYIKTWINNRLQWMDSKLGYTPPVYILGDVNNDGQVNIDDVSLLIDYLLTENVNIVTEAADCNQDGSITINDVTKLIDILLTQAN